MHNNYSTTNNFYNADHREFNSHLIQYDKPKNVVLDGEFLQFYGMLMAVVYVKEKDSATSRIETLRIPLKGPSMEPMGRYSEASLDDRNFIVLPEDKVLPAELFKRMVYSMTEEGRFHDSLKELKKAGYNVNHEGDCMELEVCISIGGFWIVCDCLNIFIRTKKSLAILPSELENILHLRNFWGKPIRFKDSSGKDDKNKQLTDELNRMLEAYESYGFYVSRTGKFQYDGTYIYSKAKNKAQMSHDEWVKENADCYELIKF